MANENCLEGLACPRCGQEDALIIVTTTRAFVTDDGAEVVGDMEWGNTSAVECPACGFHATLARFHTHCGPDDSKMTAPGFVINSRHSDDTYLFVEVDGFRISVKREAEGVVVDLLAAADPREALASTYAFHHEAITQHEGDSL